LDHQNNSVEHSSTDNKAAKDFNILLIDLNVLYNYVYTFKSQFMILKSFI